MDKQQIIVHVSIKPVENGFIVNCDERGVMSAVMTPVYVALDESSAIDRARSLVDEKLKAWDKGELDIKPYRAFPSNNIEKLVRD